MNKNKTVRWVKCTCPRGTFSHNCPVEHHRSMAWEIDTIFGLTASNNTGTGRRRKPRRLPTKRNYRRRDWEATAGRWTRGIGRVINLLLESARHKISQSGEDIEARFESLDARINRLTSMPVSDLVDAYQHDMPMLARILEMRESMIRARG